MRQCKDKGHISYPQEQPQSTSTGVRGGEAKMGHYIGGVGGGLPNRDHIYVDGNQVLGHKLYNDFLI